MTLLVTRTDDLETCRALRRAVFIDEQNVPEEEELDGLDDAALHLLALMDGQPIGTLRMFREPPEAKIGRVCVLPQFRGSGIGRALMNTALGILRDSSGITSVKLGAQLHVLDFYRPMGFEPEGPIFDDAGIPHRMMRLSL